MNNDLQKGINNITEILLFTVNIVLFCIIRDLLSCLDFAELWLIFFTGN